MKILLGDFNPKVVVEYFQTDNWEDSLHHDSNDNGVSKLRHIKKYGC